MRTHHTGEALFSFNVSLKTSTAHVRVAPMEPYQVEVPALAKPYGTPSPDFYLDSQPSIFNTYEKWVARSEI